MFHPAAPVLVYDFEATAATVNTARRKKTIKEYRKRVIEEVTKRGLWHSLCSHKARHEKKVSFQSPTADPVHVSSLMCIVRSAASGFVFRPCDPGMVDAQPALASCEAAGFEPHSVCTEHNVRIRTTKMKATTSTGVAPVDEGESRRPPFIPSQTRNTHDEARSRQASLHVAYSAQTVISPLEFSSFPERVVRSLR